MTMLGVVLCGGKSSRMGTDKGMLKRGELTWVETAFNTLSQLSIPIVVSVNSKQYISYQEFFSEENLVEDIPFVEGPLNGIISVHQKFPDANLVVLACDMVDMDCNLIRRLMRSSISHASYYDFYVYKNNGFIEPLCGVYNGSALKQIFKMVKKSDDYNGSLKKILENNRTLVMECKEKETVYFNNYNEPSSINF
jgi:molybdopterin-guanine dinucleotide biosynthesis protein A